MVPKVFEISCSRIWPRYRERRSRLHRQRLRAGKRQHRKTPARGEPLFFSSSRLTREVAGLPARVSQTVISEIGPGGRVVRFVALRAITGVAAVRRHIGRIAGVRVAIIVSVAIAVIGGIGIAIIGITIAIAEYATSG